MKKRFAYIFIADIILTIITIILFFIIGEGWTQIPISLIIVFLWFYGLTHKPNLPLFSNKTFNILFNSIGFLAIIYNPLEDSKILAIRIIAFIFQALIIIFSIYELIFLYKNET